MSLVFRAALKAICVATAMCASALAQPVTTTAKFAYVMDFVTGETLYAKNADVATAPASMSKLMTAAIVFEKLKSGELKLTDEFSVSRKAWKMKGSKMFVRVDTEIAIADLLRGVIVLSGNDACIVIAENISGTEEAFAKLMTRKAKEWGMKNSTFANASGWPDPGQKMSMRDLGILARKIISDYPEYYAIFSERNFEWENIAQDNRNPLLDNFDGADGLKTGRTDESGFGLVGSASRGGERRIIVLNGMESNRERASEAKRLLRIAFDDFEKTTVFSAGDIVANAPVFRGKSPEAPLVVSRDIAFIVHRTERDAIDAKVVFESPLPAPVAAGQEVGFVKISRADGDPVSYPVYAGLNVPELGFVGKVLLGAKRLLTKPDRSADAPSDASIEGAAGAGS